MMKILIIPILFGLAFLPDCTAYYSSYSNVPYPTNRHSKQNYNCNNCFKIRNLCRENYMPFWFCHETHSSCYYRFCYHYKTNDWAENALPIKRTHQNESTPDLPDHKIKHHLDNHDENGGEKKKYHRNSTQEISVKLTVIFADSFCRQKYQLYNDLCKKKFILHISSQPKE